MKIEVRDWTGLDISDEAVPEGDPMLDYPTAWEVCRGTRITQHHEKCSYRQTNGGILCDCVGVDAAREMLRIIAKRSSAHDAQEDSNG